MDTESRSPEDRIRSLALQMTRLRYWERADLWAKLDSRLARSLSSYNGLHAELTFDEEILPAWDLKAACLLADVTSIHLEGGWQLGFDAGPVNRSRWPFSAALSRYRRVDFGYYVPFAEKVCSELEPLTRAGRLLVRPAPALFFETHEGEEFNIRIPRNVSDPLAPLHPTLAEEAIPVRRVSQLEAQQNELLSFALPVLDNLSFEIFAKVLNEEADAIASFRTELKQLVISAKQQDVSIQERYRDVVRPAIERVERRFRATQRMHSVRAAGAALTSIGVSLTALTGSGVVSSVAAVLGPAGLGLLAKEIADSMKAQAELRELPFYLCWRLQKAR